MVQGAISLHRRLCRRLTSVSDSVFFSFGCLNFCRSRRKNVLRAGRLFGFHRNQEPCRGSEYLPLFAVAEKTKSAAFFSDGRIAHLHKDNPTPAIAPDRLSSTYSSA